MTVKTVKTPHVWNSNSPKRLAQLLNPIEHFSRIVPSKSISDSSEINMSYSQEYASFLEETERLFSMTKVTEHLGSKRNLTKLLTWIETYNADEERSRLEAADVISVINVGTFDFNYCFENKEIFWNFLKTLKTFKTAPWYYRDYVVKKILGHTINITDIL